MFTAERLRSSRGGWTLALLLLLLTLQGASDSDLRRTLQRATGTVRLPPGVVELSSPLEIPRGARDLRLQGDPAGTLLRASASFQGEAILVSRSGERIALSGFAIDGNREALERRVGLPPWNVPFLRFYPNNGILIEGGSGITVSDVELRNVANLAILVARSRQVRIERVRVEDSGSRNALGRNNTTGGILLEEGTTDFQVTDSEIRNVRGNGIWTHSMYESPRNQRGEIRGNVLENLARDAIQIGHATDVVVRDNVGRRIGFPVEEVDLEGYGFPVGVDTAGNVERSVYADNRFEEINGKCIDLDGFHHGEVRGNLCVNRQGPEHYPYGNYGIAMNNANPDMRSEFISVTDNTVDGTLYGGILVIGSHHLIRNNRLLNLNRAHCNDNRALCTYRIQEEPSFLRSGIYLAQGAERPDAARENQIEGNQISGYGMREYCIVAAPGVARQSNQIRANRCADEEGPR